MRSKTPLSLIEQLLMLLVFSIAAAICIRAFVWADEKSEFNSERAAAAVSVQSAADSLKHYRGDLEKTASAVGGNANGKILTVDYGKYSVSVTLLDDDDKFTDSALIKAVSIRSGEELITVTAVWQEESK